MAKAAGFPAEGVLVMPLTCSANEGKHYRAQAG